MTTYQDLLAKKQELDRQAATLEKALTEARRQERAGVIAKIREMMASNGLTVDDLQIKSRAPNGSPTTRAKVEPKYRNVATGETWTGRGLQPKWLKAALAAGKSLQEFEISR